MATTRKAPAKTSQAKVLPPEVISNIVLIDRDRIKVEDQVRTEFDQESIAELAADIEARGLRVPIEVTPIGDELYLLTLGGRRMKALELLGHSKIPCIIVKTAHSDRLADQLAENIQREDLSLADEAAAIRKLYDQVKEIAGVAKMVKKSVPWVSKRLALSHQEFGTWAKQLMENHQVEDIELLNAMSQIEKLNDYNTSWTIAKAIREGKMNRDQVREKLKEMKASRTQSKKDQAKDQEKQQAKREKTQAKEEERRKLREEGNGPEFIQFAMQQFGHAQCSLEEIDEIISALSSPQVNALDHHINEWAEKGRNAPWNDIKVYFRGWSPTACPIEQLAMIAGLRYPGKLNLMAFMTMISEKESLESQAA